MVKNLPANAGTTGDSSSIHGLGRSPGETHSSILVWEISWKEEPGGPQKEYDMTTRTHTHGLILHK